MTRYLYTQCDGNIWCMDFNTCKTIRIGSIDTWTELDSHISNIEVFFSVYYRDVYLGEYESRDNPIEVLYG